MMQYEVWTEGYAISGSVSGADFHGKFEGETFKDAVIAFKETIKSERDKSLVDIDGMSFWGCKFYDNEIDARKSFG